MPDVKYFALYRGDLAPGENPEQGYTSTCVGLFQDLDDVLAEARDHLNAGEVIEITPGSMSQEEWDALEEVPDDFQPEPAHV